jgi:UDPglucose 6-dehydrogenase
MSHKVLIEKSTVPLGTANIMKDKLQKLISGKLDKQSSIDEHYTLVNMPEFLAEGTAINDLVKPQRVVIGTQNDNAFALMSRLSQGFESEPT